MESENTVITNSISYDRVKKALLVCAGLAASFYIMLYAYSMATTSLWNDELYSILKFSSLGWRTAVTDYHVPNNHIFFNLINSLTPYSDSVEPLRARLWSFVGFFLALFFSARLFYKENLIIEGLILITVVYCNSEVLSLCLQARGYGIVLACASALIYALFYFYKQENYRYLGVAGLAAVVGVWTVPVFLLFAAPIFLFVFLILRNTKTLFIGAGVAILIGLVYTPVIRQLLSVASTHGDIWGRPFQDFKSILVTIVKYSNGGVLTVALIAAGAGAALLRWKKIFDRSDFRYVLTIWTATIILFVGCLVMETPAVRTVSFIVLPLVTVSVFVVGLTCRSLIDNKAIEAVVVCCLAFSLLLSNTSRIRSYSFVPIENWLEVGRFIEQTIPDNFHVIAGFRNNFLRVYLDEKYPIKRKSSDLSDDSLARIIVESDFTKDKLQRFDGRSLNQAAGEYKVGQLRGGYQSVWVFPTAQRDNIRRIIANDNENIGPLVLDNNVETNWTAETDQSQEERPVSIDIELLEGKAYKSLVLIFDSDNAPDDVLVRVKSGDSYLSVSKKYLFKSGDVFVIALENREVEGVELKMFSSNKSSAVSINEVWVYETSHGDVTHSTTAALLR